MRLSWLPCAALLLVVVAPVAPARELRTDDGLTVGLDDATGQVTGVGLDGRPLPVTGDPGGLFVQEFRRADDLPSRELLALDFERASAPDEPTWTSALMGAWDDAPGFAERMEDDAAEGMGFLRIGDGREGGAGMAAAETVDVAPDEVLTISWAARSASTEGTFILCLRLFGADGRDLTETAVPPPGWQYTPYTNAHYKVGFRANQPDEWQRFTYEYVVPPAVTRVRLSLRVYTEGALQADVDAIRITARPGGWADERPVRAPLTGGDAPVQAAEVEGLRVTVQYAAHPGHLSAQVSVACADPERADRALRLIWRLPIAAVGWRWAADPLDEATIDPGYTYQDGVGFAGHPTGRYPLESIASDAGALALATPLDPPTLQGFRCDDAGFATGIDLALSSAAPEVPGRFSFVIYRHDPAWGFRAALERYYALFPALFEGTAPRGGCWTLRLPDAATPDADNFGLAFYECGDATAAQRDWCREHGALTFRYIEPWGVRQYFPEATEREDLPPYEERLALLEAWAAEEQTDEQWQSFPRNEMARALLNSMVSGADGRAPYFEDMYTTWSTWWQTNSDPDLPSPNIAEWCGRTRIVPAIEWADGIYVDSVSPTFASHEDYAPEHLAASDLPLTFSPASGDPVVLSGMAHAEFLTWLRGYLHERGKLLMFNLHPHATRLYGHLADVTGCELVGFQDDVQAMQQRVYAYHRPVSNLMQWRSAVQVRVPAMTAEEMRRHFDNQLLYGFWPGISTAGGGTEPGYANMQRYFLTPELFERDRELFRQYLPIFDALNAAGWEPVPHARAEPDSVRAERYGGPGGDAYLAVHNPSDHPVTGTLRLEGGWWGQRPGEGLALQRLVEGGELPAEADGDELVAGVTLAPRRTEVLRVVPE